MAATEKYCSLDDIKKRIPERELIDLTDDNDTGSVDTAVVDAIIISASNEINSYCQERYAEHIPFDEASVPSLIKDLCVELSVYKLKLRRNRVDESWEAIYDHAIKTLEKISKGTVSLGLAKTSTIKANAITFTNKTVDDRIFKDPQGY